jgi:hypothetical protein
MSTVILIEWCPIWSRTQAKDSARLVRDCQTVQNAPGVSGCPSEPENNQGAPPKEPKPLQAHPSQPPLEGRVGGYFFSDKRF